MTGLGSFSSRINTKKFIPRHITLKLQSLWDFKVDENSIATKWRGTDSFNLSNSNKVNKNWFAPYFSEYFSKDKDKILKGHREQKIKNTLPLEEQG